MLAIALLWLLFRPASESVPDVADALSGVQVADDAAAEADAAAGEQAEVETEQSTLESDGLDDSSGGSGTISFDGPPFDEPVNLYLFAGNGRQLTRLDLAAGGRAVYDLSGLPVAVHDDEIFLFDAEVGLSAVSVQDPLSPARVVVAIQDLVPAAPQMQMFNLELVAPGVVGASFFIFRDSGQVADVSRFISLDDGSVTEARDGSGFGLDWAGLTWVPAGGLYRLDEDGGNTKLADGQPIALGRERLVVRECAGPGDCAEFWIDLDGRRLNVPVPRIGDDWTARQVDLQGRLLQIEGSSPRYFDVVNDRFLPGDLPALRFDTGGLQFPPDDLSEDGRFLALRRGPDIVVHDLVTGQTHESDVGIGQVQRVLWAPALVP